MPLLDVPSVDQLEEMRSRYLNKLIRFDRSRYNNRAVGIVTSIVTYGEKYPSPFNGPEEDQLTFDLTGAKDDDPANIRNYWLRPELMEVWGES